MEIQSEGSAKRHEDSEVGSVGRIVKDGEEDKKRATPQRREVRKEGGEKNDQREVKEVEGEKIVCETK